MPAVKQILQRLESRKQLSGRRTLQNLYGIGNRQRRRDGYEQMDMIRLGHLRSMQIALMAKRSVSAIPPVSIRLRYFGHHITRYAVWYTPLRLYTISSLKFYRMVMNEMLVSQFLT